jgi:hypothetical protein
MRSDRDGSRNTGSPEAFAPLAWPHHTPELPAIASPLRMEPVLPTALLAREAAESAAAPGRRPGSNREMQFCRTFGRNHLLRSVL